MHMISLFHSLLITIISQHCQAETALFIAYAFLALKCVKKLITKLTLFLKKKKIKLHMLLTFIFESCLIKNHWHYTVFRRLHPTGRSISFTKEYKTSMVLGNFFFFSLMEIDKPLMLLWDNWCHDGPSRDLHIYKQFVMKFTVSKWKRGKFVKLLWVHKLPQFFFCNSD